MKLNEQLQKAKDADDEQRRVIAAHNAQAREEAKARQEARRARGISPWSIVTAVLVTVVVLTFVVLWTIPQTRCSLTSGTWVEGHDVPIGGGQSFYTEAACEH